MYMYIHVCSAHVHVSEKKYLHQASVENVQASSYDQLLRQLVSNEEKYISHLNLILKVFQEPFTKRPDLFPSEVMFTVYAWWWVIHVHVHDVTCIIYPDIHAQGCLLPWNFICTSFPCLSQVSEYLSCTFTTVEGISFVTDCSVLIPQPLAYMLLYRNGLDKINVECVSVPVNTAV